MATRSVHPETDLVSVIDTYARRICPPILDQHAGNSVSSPLGIWLLLAACATGSFGAERTALEEVLGCTASTAAGLLSEFLDAPPAALRNAMALWATYSLDPNWHPCRDLPGGYSVVAMTFRGDPFHTTVADVLNDLTEDNAKKRAASR